MPIPFPVKLINQSLGLAFLTLGSLSFAQTNVPEKPQEKAVKGDAKKEVQQVEVKGKVQYDERRFDTATKIVVTQEEILKYGDNNLGDVLKRLPGVTIGGVPGRGGGIRMRGLGAGYTQVMLNGEPAPPGFSLDSLNPEMVEKIEVIRAATAETTTQAIAGAINIVLKKSVSTAQKEIKLGMQRDGEQWGGGINFQLADKDGNMSYAIGGGFLQGNYDRPSYLTERSYLPSGTPSLIRQSETNSEGKFTAINAAPRVNWSFSNGDVLTTQSFINANRFSGNNTEKVSTSLGALPNYSSNSQAVNSDSAMIRTNLNWIRKLENSAKLDLKFGVNFNKRSSDVSFLGYNEKSLQTLARTSDSSATDKGLTMSGKYSAPFVEDHAIVIGWDGAYSKRNETRIQTDKVSNGNTLSPQNLNEVFDANVTRLAFFAQDEWQFTKQLSVYGGIRWEGIQTKSSGTGYADVDNKSSVFSPIFQALYRLPDSKNNQFRVGITRTYKAPDTGAIIPRRFVSLNNSATSPDSMGNPNLKPELAWGLDLAYEYYLPKGGSMSASLYARRITDITTRQTSLQNGVWVSMPVNAGTANTHGLELDAKLPLRSLMDDAPAIEMRANLAFNFSKIDTIPGPNNRLDSQTPISANFGLDYTVDGMPLTLGGNLSFQNAGWVQVSDTQSSYGTVKRVLDLFALWKFDRKSNIRFSLSNALHQDNIGISSFTGNYGRVSQETLNPTTVTARIQYEHKF